MAELQRDAVVRILKTLLANTEADARRSVASRDWFDGRASGLKSALEIVTNGEESAKCLDCGGVENDHISNYYCPAFRA